MKINPVLMHMHWTKNMGMPVDFRDEFSHFVAAMRSNVAKDIHKRGDQFEVGEYLLYLPIYSKMFDIA